MSPRLNKFRNKSLKAFSLFCLLLICLLFFSPALKSVFLNALKQPLSLITLFQREIGGIIFFHRNLVQGERLRKEIGLLRNKINALDEVSLENARLKNLLSLKEKSAFKVIAARVIARSPDSWSSSIIIDKGSYNGIKRGMGVINYLGLVGRVMETTKFTSKIMLISDPNLGVSALVQRSRQEGLVSGTLGTYLTMRYLPKDADIKIQDVIVSSGLNEVYPKGLLIGTVIDIGKEFSGLSRFATIKPAIDLSNIEEVLIIIP